MGLMRLRFHVHAIDHLADCVGQAGRILLKHDQLLIEVLGENESLGHVVIHGGDADGVDLLLVELAFMLIARHLGTVGVGRNLVLGNACVHGAGLDGLDEAFDGERHGVGAEAELHRRIADFLENRLGPVQGLFPRIDERLDDVMQVSVAHAGHGDGSVHGRYHHHIIGAVDAGVDHARREHRLADHNKAPTAVGQRQRQNRAAGERRRSPGWSRGACR